MSTMKIVIFWIIATSSFILSLFTSVFLANYLSTQVQGESSLIAAGFVVVGGGTCSGQFLLPLLWNLFLLILFVFQHRWMASESWKNILNLLGISPVERAIYAIATTIILNLIMFTGKTFPGLYLWNLDTSIRPFHWLFFFLFHGVLWMTIFAAALGKDILKMTGIRQVYDHVHVGRFEHSGNFGNLDQVEQLGKSNPHPGMMCFLAILWVHPIMSFERFILSLILTWHILFFQRSQDLSESKRK